MDQSASRANTLRMGIFEGFKKGYLFWSIFIFYAPLAFWARFYFWENAILEPHPWRQTQTALTILHLFQGTATLWDYRSPLGGILWNNVYEFPLYQWVASLVMHLGLSLEVASRLVTVLSFFTTGFFSYLIIKKILSREIALWFTLVFLVNPFGVVFSRVCLIDFFALAATLSSVYGLIKIRSNEATWSTWFLLATGGVIAGLAKINIWFFIYFASFVIVFGALLKQRQSQQNKLIGLMIVTGLQCAIIFLWNYYRLMKVGSPADTPWLIGEFSQRLELWRWKKILWEFLVRSLFYDWLFVPFLIGTFQLFRKSRLIFTIVFFVFIAHTLVFFQVQTFHDYYLIACMPYLLLVAACGLNYLSSSETKTAKLIGSALLVIVIFKSFYLKYYYSPITHDYRVDLKPIYQLKNLTSKQDVVYWDAKQGRFEIATYSQRNVGLSETAHLIGKMTKQNELFYPSVFRFDSKPDFSMLSSNDLVWIDGDESFFIYRTKSNDSFVFNPNEQLAVLDLAPQGKKVIPFVSSVENCTGEGSLLMNIPPRLTNLMVTPEGNAEGVLLPTDKPFVNLPSRGAFGCSFQISGQEK